MGHDLGMAWRRLARSILEVTEKVMLRVTRTLHRETGVEYLCIARGVALNCVGKWVDPTRGALQGHLDSARSDSRAHLHMLRCNLRVLRDVLLFSETTEPDYLPEEASAQCRISLSD